MRPTTHDKLTFSGAVTAVKARIRLLRSFDQVSHAYLGYALVLDGTVEEVAVDDLRVAIGPKAYGTHRFRIGDQVEGRGGTGVTNCRLRSSASIRASPSSTGDSRPTATAPATAPATPPASCTECKAASPG